MNIKTSMACAMVLTTMGATAVTSVAAPATQAQAATTTTVNRREAAAARSLGVYTKGSLTASGTAVNGLRLQANNTVTTGQLNLQYSATSISTALSENSKYVVKVPKELQPLVASKDFKQYISGSFKCKVKLGGTAKRTYTEDDMSIASDGSTISFDNPQMTYLIGSEYTINVTLDLGQAVTNSGIRIANSSAANGYHFDSAVTPASNAINWSAVGNYNAGATLPTVQLDPGYDLLHTKPTIEKVTDKSTYVTGTGTPGAKVTVKVGDKVIGTGTVDANRVYVIDIPKQHADVTLSVTQNTGVGESDAATTVVQHEASALPAPTLTPGVYAQGAKVTGIGDTPGDKITVMDANRGNVLGISYVNSDKTFAVGVSNAGSNTVISVYESNNDGDKSQSTFGLIQ
ncbi:Ig-like domain-containing protein [Levilactobacillus bambusae]|uniref:Bacterial Ig domain-containing protein n=1 Tax=Levilactobacillus bambusae TaxID=2024736 RepID=A0A2V1MZU1_9LACO|nr:Ig-like domain-containing protein [Levilactobacillus bambusae]PWF99645.1 hypothetical protein DCM90_07455 [Levilactobacillus bambusae]